MKIKKGFTLRTIGGVSAITSDGNEQVDFNKLVSLNASASYLWTSLEGIDFNISMVSRLLISRYNISEEEAHTDAIDIVEKWEQAGLIDL